jgi:DNA invertase Pin-like site-specific DNA recombinase
VSLLKTLQLGWDEKHLPNSLDFEGRRLPEPHGGYRHNDTCGRMMMQMVGAFAEFERAMLRERTRVGLEIARKDGRVGGRRPKLSERQQAEILRMIRRGEKTAAEAARLFKIHPATVCRLQARTVAYAK